MFEKNLYTNSITTDSCVRGRSGGVLTTTGFNYNDFISDMSKASTAPQLRMLSNKEKLNPKNIKKVIFNPPATIMIFADDTKIVTKTHKELNFDPEKGVMACMMRLVFDTRASFNRLVDKAVEEAGLNLEGEDVE